MQSVYLIETDFVKPIVLPRRGINTALIEDNLENYALNVFVHKFYSSERNTSLTRTGMANSKFLPTCI